MDRSVTNDNPIEVWEHVSFLIAKYGLPLGNPPTFNYGPFLNPSRLQRIYRLLQDEFCCERGSLFEIILRGAFRRDRF